MDKLTRYREVIRRVMDERANWRPNAVTVASERIEDTARDHYLLKYVGWDGGRRVHATAFHLDIIDGKVWVQFDGSNRSVTDALVDAGIPKEDIVPAEQPPEVRASLGYAVG